MLSVQRLRRDRHMHGGGVVRGTSAAGEAKDMLDSCSVVRTCVAEALPTSAACRTACADLALFVPVPVLASPAAKVASSELGHRLLLCPSMMPRA